MRVARDGRRACHQGRRRLPRRIERNLDDGAPQRPESLALSVRVAQKTLPDDAAADAVLAEVSDELIAALTELWELARAEFARRSSPSTDSVRADSLVGRSPVPVDLTVSLTERLPGSVEATAYYLVAER
jgi:hypothetical protein